MHPSKFVQAADASGLNYYGLAGTSDQKQLERNQLGIVFNVYPNLRWRCHTTGDNVPHYYSP